MEKLEQQKISTRSPLSILIGLRNKFAREIDKKVVYSAQELHFMMTESIKKINQQEIINDIKANEYKIKRYNWKKIIGTSLTQQILTYRKEGLDVNQTFSVLCKNEKIMKFIQEYPYEQEKLMENLEISINARYGENNTSEKIKHSK